MMEDEVMDDAIDAERARALHAEACRDHALVSWVVYCDTSGGVRVYFARLMVRAKAWPYCIVADSLSEIAAQLPPGLRREPRGRSDPPEVVETWCVP